ncbi:GH39 family glycosyl hydrolase [Motilibacter rhizosphaerae]|uniref:GH39 family glycosyl hydrolase n=1 Tax=Motilibacter rhizosphaerae TaxID=598652 RepID=UPI0013EEA09C|nr:glycosyl hydrolase [Motilibacter rhizosphaerae]
MLPGSSGTAVGAAGSAPVLGAATAPPRPSTARAAGPAAQAPGRTTPWAFGIHGSPAGGEDAFGTVRLWDAGTTWSDLQPAPGRWDWTRLDAAVLDAESRRLEPVLVLGQTPAWASSDTRVPGMLHPGASMPPLDPRTWSAYVSAVATRYRGRIRGYEVWNEPNYVSDYYHGTEQQLASLTVLARTALRAADPGALLIGPGFATRTQGQLGWLYRYLDALPARTLDVVALHLYPPAGQGPEQAVAQLQTVEAALAGRGITAPVWNTEVNLGVVGGTSLATPVPAPLDGAYVARLLLLSRAAGIERTYWYTWSWLGNVGINLLQPDGAPSGALGAWRRVGAWMTHSTLDGCSAAGAVWTCTLRPDAGGTAQVVWTTGPGTTYAVPGGTAGVLGLEGSVSPVPASGRIPLTAVPVLLPDARQSLRQLADASMQ